MYILHLCIPATGGWWRFRRKHDPRSLRCSNWHRTRAQRRRAFTHKQATAAKHAEYFRTRRAARERRSIARIRIFLYGDCFSKRRNCCRILLQFCSDAVAHKPGLFLFSRSHIAREILIRNRATANEHAHNRRTRARSRAQSAHVRVHHTPSVNIVNISH